MPQALQYVHHFEVPDQFHVKELLGKGSNNKVYRVKWNDSEYVLRAPRRRSDTQQRGNAAWEYRHTLRASELEVGPTLHMAWCARHANGQQWPSGLYMVTDRFEHDVEAVLADKGLREQFNDMGDAVVKCLTRLSRDLMFMYDLKPSNVVVRLDETGNVHARIIDFGHDFCEWGGASSEDDHNTPNLNLIRKLTDGDEAIVSHVIFACMLVQLSATTTFHLFQDRSDHRMSKEMRQNTNPFPKFACRMLDSMRGCHKRLLRRLLRTDEVRSVLRHYLGRRNSGTGRVLRFSQGQE